MVGTLPIRVLAGGLQLSFQLRSVGVQFGERSAMARRSSNMVAPTRTMRT
jgi:hypothetical protein